MFECSFLVPYYGLAPGGKMKVGVFLELFQEAADLHTRRIGASVDDMQEQGMTWIMRRYHVEIHRYPGREQLTVRTAYEPQGNLRSIRTFEALDSSDNVLATALSSWIVINLENNRPMRLDRVLPHGYYAAADSDCRCPKGEMPSIGLDSEQVFEKEFQPRHAEMDINGHVNHTVYCTWALEAAYPCLSRPALPRTIDVEYLLQVEDEDVIVRSQPLPESPSKLVQSIVIAESGKEAARVATAWMAQQ